MAPDDWPREVSITVKIAYAAWVEAFATPEAIFEAVTEVLPGVIGDPDDQTFEGAGFVRMEEV